MTQMDARIAELVARLTALERECAEDRHSTIGAEWEDRGYTKWSLPQKRVIPSTGIHQSKRRLPCFAGFSVAAQMSSQSVGRIVRRNAAATHPPVRTNGSVGFAKNQKSNVRHVQIRHSRLSMTYRSNAIYAGPTRMALRSLWVSIRCLRTIPVRSWPQTSTKGNGEEMFSLLGRPVSVTRFLLPLSGRDPETVLMPGSFSRSRYRQRRRAISGHSLSPTRWNVSQISDSGLTIGSFQARIQCRRVGSAI